MQVQIPEKGFLQSSPRIHILQPAPVRPRLPLPKSAAGHLPLRPGQRSLPAGHHPLPDLPQLKRVQEVQQHDLRGTDRSLYVHPVHDQPLGSHPVPQRALVRGDAGAVLLDHVQRQHVGQPLPEYTQRILPVPGQGHRHGKGRS